MQISKCISIKFYACEEKGKYKLESYVHAYRPLSQRQILIVSQFFSHFEDEMTRDRSPRVLTVWHVDWVLVIIANHCFQVLATASAVGLSVAN